MDNNEIVLSRSELESEKDSLMAMIVGMSNELAAIESRAMMLRNEISGLNGQVIRINVILQKDEETDKNE